MENLTRPAWLEVDLDALVHNYRIIRGSIPSDVEFLIVVKSDAYEHGAVQVVKTLKEVGAKAFAVAILSEALHLKRYIDDLNVLVLGYTPDHLLEKAIESDCALTMYLEEQAILANNIAKRLNKKVRIHLKIETGMNRLGFLPNDDSIKAIERVSKLDNLILEGMYTHFAASDDDVKYTEEQVAKFDMVVNELEKLGIRIPLKHVKNSAAIVNFKMYNYDMVRAGAIIYGIELYPMDGLDGNVFDFHPVLTMKAQIANVKEIEAGEKVSYGLTFEAKKKTKIATVPVGYADGYGRLMSNKGRGIIKDTYVPVVGRVCMDQLMVDVTGLDVEIGDEIVLIGKSGDKIITLNEVGANIGGIASTALCMINRRLPRVYVQDNKVIDIVDYTERM